MSVSHLSVAYIGPKSRTERLKNKKSMMLAGLTWQVGKEVALVTRQTDRCQTKASLNAPAY